MRKIFPLGNEWWKGLPEEICSEARLWALGYSSPFAAWTACDRADWMAWWLMFCPPNGTLFLTGITPLFRNTLDVVTTLNRPVFGLVVGKISVYSWQPSMENCNELQTVVNRLTNIETTSMGEKKLVEALQQWTSLLCLPLEPDFRKHLPSRIERCTIIMNIVQNLAWARASHLRTKLASETEWKHELKLMAHQLHICFTSPPNIS